MSYEKIARLVTALKQKTKTQELTWNGTETEGVYETSFPHYSVRISKTHEYNEQTQDIESIMILEVINQNGEIIEQISDGDLALLIQKPYSVMKEIHDTARRQVMGVEDALDEILNLIDPEVPF